MGDAAAQEKRKAWQLGLPFSSHFSRPFLRRYLDLVFLNSTFTNSKISMGCLQMATCASLTVGLSSEFA